MKVNEIEELLVRYYDGETNEAEEKELKEFFAQADVPAHLLAEKRLFMQLASQPEPECSPKRSVIQTLINFN